MLQFYILLAYQRGFPYKVYNSCVPAFILAFSLIILLMKQRTLRGDFSLPGIIW